MVMKLMIPLMMWLTVACGPANVASNNSQEKPAAPSPPAAPQPPPDKGGQPVVPHDVPAGAPKPQIPAAINDLLDRLEKSAADLRSFTGNIQYEKEDPLLGRKELRAGNLIYHHDPESREKSFAILFEKAIINGRQSGEAKHYIFNGRWLAEVDHNNRQFIKREIVPPGKQLDPLKLGEGPFPLPIGQPKADVLARFDVTVASMPSEGLLKILQNVDGVSLAPKPGTREAKDFTKVDLYYDRETLLPVGIRTTEVNGDRKTVRLLDVKRNPKLTADQLAKLDIKEPDPRTWRIDVRPWAAE
jgi:hypothetical protein